MNTLHFHTSKRALAVFASFALIAVPVASESPFALSLSLQGATSLPHSMVDPGASEYYEVGGGGTLGIELSPNAFPLFMGGFQVGAVVNTITGTQDTINLMSAGAGIGFKVPLKAMEFRTEAHGGYYYGTYGSTGAGNLFYDASQSILFKVSSAIGVGVQGGWRDFLSLDSGGMPKDAENIFLMRGIFAGLSVVMYPSELRARSRLEIREIEFRPVYPIMMKYYDSHPLGTVTFRNREAGDITNVRVSLFIPGYMDAPKICAVIPRLKKDESATVELTALFNASILKITESVMNSAEVKIEYLAMEKSALASNNESMRILDRNAMTWDDDKKAAAFVTAKDETVLAFSKILGSAAQADQAMSADKSLKTAIGIFESLSLYGIRYVKDPKTPFSELSETMDSVDYLQFPAQTLAFKSGDCDDLTIMNCALLESVGVETAMVTTPGHIFTAIAVGMNEKEALSYFSSKDLFIVKDGKVWLPIENTLLSVDGFTAAWKLGALEYREAEAKGEANLFPIHESWKMYEPVGFSPGSSGGNFPSFPELKAAQARWSKEYAKFAESETSGREKALRAEIAAAKDGKGKLQNKLGVLLARFGRYEAAKKEFTEAVKTEPVSANINLGNIAMLAKEYTQALGFYRSCLAKQESNLTALLGASLAASKCGLEAESEAYLEKVKAINADSAKSVTDTIAQDKQGRSADSGGAVTAWLEE